nr:RNA-directed DNA polymerase, eukaryota [Tanacetum cinerariifolium]
TPFRLYHSWFKREGFDAMVEQAWLSFSHNDSNSLIRFKKKLQDLKKVIRVWIRDMNILKEGVKSSLTDKLVDIDKELDNGVISDDMLLNRLELSRKLRAQLAIRGVFDNGVWLTDPPLVKNSFLNHFASRFKQLANSHLKLNMSFPNRLTSDQIDDLERNITRDEIKAAVWDCDENKSPVDFAKAYDFVRWDFLLDALHAFGFGSRWCSWIRGIFSSNMASILVNGSPTSEFLISCGLKQGDPLAPLLFILVMEPLHISVSLSIHDGVFKGLLIHDSMVLS